MSSIHERARSRNVFSVQRDIIGQPQLTRDGQEASHGRSPKATSGFLTFASVETGAMTSRRGSPARRRDVDSRAFFSTLLVLGAALLQGRPATAQLFQWTPEQLIKYTAQEPVRSLPRRPTESP